MDSREKYVLGRWKIMCGGFEMRKNLVCVRDERGKCMEIVGFFLGFKDFVFFYYRVFYIVG